jgi:tetratricopeptide (TPR) repeat protein
MPSGPPTSSPRPRFPQRLHTAWLVALVFGVTLAAYLPCLGGAPLWDDAAHITAPALRSWHALHDIWFQLGTTQQYYPVLHSAFWLEHRLWGDAVVGYHLANVLLHATSACLFALVLTRIRPLGASGDAWTGSGWLAALVFALHPVCVESVAWISEQKNTLSLVFYLLAFLAYLRFDLDRAGRTYVLALVLFILAVLSKSVTATLPCALLLALAWRRGSLSWRRDAAPLVPWILVGAAAGLFTAWVERTYIGARGMDYDLGPIERLFLAGRIVWFYLGKLVWPSGLTFIYPHWQVSADWSWSLGLLGLVAVTAALAGLRKWSAAPLIALLFFVGSLFPALGFFNVYPFRFSYVADHWQYLPCLGVIALAAEGAAAGAVRALRLCSGAQKAALAWVFGVAFAALLAVLFTLTWRQSGLYRNVGTLYSDTLAKNPACWMAHNNLGMALTESGRPAEAIPYLREAVRLKPDYADAHNNLGNALAKVPGGSAESVSEFEAALRIEPGMAEANGNLGSALVNIPGRVSEGISHLRTALQGNADKPEFADLHVTLGNALETVPGGLPEAVSEFEAALRAKPGAANARIGLGDALAGSGRLQEAAAQFGLVLQAHPDNADAHINLGNVLTQLGRGPEAIVHYREAIRLKPDRAAAHVDLGRALRNVGDGSEAIAEYEAALRLAPGSPEVLNSLATVYFKHDRIAEAVARYREASRLRPDVATYHANLGTALTSAGSLDEAIAQFRTAIRLSPGYADAHYNLGVALHQAGREDEAAAEFRASGRAGP